MEFPAISMPVYARRIGYSECAFFGINHPDNAAYACRELWTYEQRQNIEHALLLAQGLIEEVLRYHLVPKWIAGESHLANDLYVCEMGYVIEPGVMTDTIIEAGSLLDYTMDPARGAVSGVSCNQSDIHLFLPGTDIEVQPSQLAVVGTDLYFSVPWCRLKAEAYFDQEVEYDDVLTWGTDSLDVRCVTNDSTTQAKVRFRSGCDCAETVTDECIYIVDGRLGLVKVPGTCGCAMVELNYRSGLSSVPRQAEDAIIRLAHVNLPVEPCGCAVTQRMWEHDRMLPTWWTRDRIECPFGLENGAWQAYVYANNMRLVRGGLL